MKGKSFADIPLTSNAEILKTAEEGNESLENHDTDVLGVFNAETQQLTTEQLRQADVTQLGNIAAESNGHERLLEAFSTQSGGYYTADFHGNADARRYIGLGDLLPPTLGFIEYRNEEGNLIYGIRAQLVFGDKDIPRDGYLDIESLNDGKPPRECYLAILGGEQFRKVSAIELTDYRNIIDGLNNQAVPPQPPEENKSDWYKLQPSEVTGPIAENSNQQWYEYLQEGGTPLPENPLPEHPNVFVLREGLEKAITEIERRIKAGELETPRPWSHYVFVKFDWDHFLEQFGSKDRLIETLLAVSAHETANFKMFASGTGPTGWYHMTKTNNKAFGVGNSSDPYESSLGILALWLTEMHILRKNIRADKSASFRQLLILSHNHGSDKVASNVDHLKQIEGSKGNPNGLGFYHLVEEKGKYLSEYFAVMQKIPLQEVAEHFYQSSWEDIGALPPVVLATLHLLNKKEKNLQFHMQDDRSVLILPTITEEKSIEMMKGLRKTIASKDFTEELEGLDIHSRPRITDAEPPYNQKTFVLAKN